jgi:hypothetical protein
MWYVRWRWSSDSIGDYLRSGGYKRILILVLAVALLISAGLIGREATEGDTPSAPTDEEKLSEICSQIEGVGRCRVTLVYPKDGEVYSAAVVCDGADDTRVRARLTDILTTLLGIGSNRISILKFNE